MLKKLKGGVITIGIAALVGLILSFVIHMFTEREFAFVLKIVGGVYVFAGLASQMGSAGINRDYNYNMAKMSTPSLAKQENELRLNGGSFAFMFFASISGGLLFALGYVLGM